MSLPSITYKCNRCDYSQCGAVAWGTEEYVLQNGLRLRAPSQLGWCHDCKDLAPIESISIEDRLADIQRIENDLAECVPPPILPWWRLDRFIFREGARIIEEYRAQRQHSLTAALADAHDLLDLQQRRKTPARCMECGTTNVTAPFITNESPWEDRSQPRPTGFIHPDCGGEIVMVDDGLRIGLGQSVRRYTPDGDFIEKVKLDGYSSPKDEFYSERDASNTKARSQ
jgi:hypothetical protein